MIEFIINIPFYDKLGMGMDRRYWAGIEGVIAGLDGSRRAGQAERIMTNGCRSKLSGVSRDVNRICLDMLSVVIARVYALFIHRYVICGVAIRQLSGRRPDVIRDGGGQGYGQAVMTVSTVWARGYVTPQGGGGGVKYI